MKTEKIMVSICCAVYNHLPYLKRVLDGFLEQNTTFEYEIIINDDVSTDGSREVLKEYQQKYPDKFRVLFQEENQYSKGKKILFDVLIPEARGKYISICEGDDYWDDPYKLQRQFEIMEREETCVFCVHKVQDVDAEGQPLGHTYPPQEVEEGLISQAKFMDMLFAPSMYWFHTSSFFFRADEVKRFDRSYPDFIKKAGVGDVPLTWLLASRGDIYYIDEVMSYYRRDVNGSWSSRMQQRQYRRNMTEKMYDSMVAYDVFTEYKYADLLREDILKCQFDCLRLSNQFLVMRRKEYRKYYEELSYGQRLKIFLCFLLPKLENIYEGITKK